MIWTIIMIAYLGYLRHDSKQHKESNYKMWGGKYMAYSILGFFAFIFIILLINSATRYAVLSAPVWFVIMLLMYQNIKRISQS